MHVCLYVQYIDRLMLMARAVVHGYDLIMSDTWYKGNQF
jgi:hypothetical protein